MDDFDKYYKAVIRFLSFRPRSEKEIRDYLLKKKANDLISERIIQSLKKDKFLDDQEFVKWWIEQRTLINPRAWRVIRIELRRKGISDELIESSGFKEEVDKASALKLAERKMRRLGKIENRYKAYESLGRYLASKGFSWDTVKEAIDQVLPK